ncbi:MAG TPA: glycosyl hydrolase family 79 C-terminal domain-containing protein [Puia sp.]|nr:glycosyl hydrolase family 79 C-terminal domain-containing protein [Puia sp.]
MSNKLAAFVAGVILFVSSCTKPNPIPDIGNQIPSAGDIPVAVTVDVSRSAVQIPANFTGLSFEKASLINSTWFGPYNIPLNNMVKALGQGVLRVGGASVDVVQWTDIVPQGSTNYISGVEAQAFLSFAEATGWPISWGVASDPVENGWVQAEVSLLAETYYSRDFLTYFEIGNEPDLYSLNGLRPSSYTYEGFKNDWTTTKDIIDEHYTTSTPHFAGPETSGNSWTGAFVRDRHSFLSALTEHYYKLGTGNDTTESIQRLLDGNDDVLARVAVMKSIAAPYNLPIRLSECNSVAGAKEGVSNTLAAALWGLDFMFALAQQGIAGVNFHGGNAPSTPIVFLSGPAKPGPLYYGMLFFAQATTGKKMLTVQSTPQSPINLTTYATQQTNGVVKVTLINKDLSKEAFVTLSAANTDLSFELASATRLNAPSLSSTNGILFGGSAVAADGTWEATKTDDLVIAGNTTTVKVPAGSAVLLTLYKVRSKGQ